MSKLSKRKNDITFIDPKTMQARCTFNQCIDKFTIEGIEVNKLPNGNEFTTAYHECTECGQRVKGRGDSKRAWFNHVSRVAEGENDFYRQDNKDLQTKKYMTEYEIAMEKFKAKKAAEGNKE